ncbi:ANKRD50 [Symbiodinium sp. CCMP2592]|nr:ANKRD50 [Symbiodinium sp. CCMP2592]
MLAADIEFLRTRICADQLEFDVGSYGTAVAATYANMYPERVGKIMLASSMPPVPETLTFAKGNGMAMTQAFAQLERLCLEGHSDCQGHSFDTQNDSTLTDQWLSLTETIRAGQLTATTNMTNNLGDYVQFPLTIGLVQGYLQEKMGDAERFSEVFKIIQKLEEANEQQIIDILDYYCKLTREVANESTTIRTWYTYGVCVGGQSVGSAFIAEPAILAQDYFGRFAVAQGMEAYRDFKTTWNDAMAVGPFVGLFSVLSSWKAEAVPVQPGFRAGIQAVALGNLYDPHTPFIWSNQMRESLPDGVQIIWQGGGHGEQHNDNMKDCKDAIDRFWRTGKLPPDGLTCRTPKFR